MEILKTEPITQTPWYVYVIATFAIVFFIAYIFSTIKYDERSIATICMIFVITSVIALILVHKHQSFSGKNRYVIEITDDAVFKDLVIKHYEITKLYENRNIYEVEGEPLE